MSKYTTGELAKLCGVTVRTVQYYDSRNLLVPSSLSEGGRRLYSEEDLQKLRIICFLRELKLPIDSIRQVFQEEHPEMVLSALLEQQTQLLASEIQERQEALTRMTQLQSGLRRIRHFTVESIGDIAHIMEQETKWRRTIAMMLAVGFVMDAIEVSTLMVGIYTGVWYPFVLGMLAVIGLGIWVSLFYHNRTMYLCPHCHQVFQPSLKETLWARHTPRTRKLTCPGCGIHGFCLETYGTKEDLSCLTFPI